MILVWTGTLWGRGPVEQLVDESDSESPQQESSDSHDDSGVAGLLRTAGEDRCAKLGDAGEDGEEGDSVDVPDDEDVAEVFKAVGGVAARDDTMAGTTAALGVGVDGRTA